jgi:hypothetical protein
VDLLRDVRGVVRSYTDGGIKRGLRLRIGIDVGMTL